MNLSTEIIYIKGVGPKRAEILQQELGIYTAEDMLFYFPYKYIDRSKFYKIKDIVSDNTYMQITGKFCCFSTEGQGRKKYLHAEFFDETGSVDVVWFQRIDWVKKTIKKDKIYVIFGKPNRFRNKFSFAHPEFETLEDFKQFYKAPLSAEYSTSEKMKKFFLNSKAVAKLSAKFLLKICDYPKFYQKKFSKIYNYPK
jgi:ATP-dependent DNA helicase RecG